MNRRRFLSMFAAIPAVFALPKIGDIPLKVVGPKTVRIVVQSSMNNFRSDLQYATVLAGIGLPSHRGETFLDCTHRPRPNRVCRKCGKP